MITVEKLMDWFRALQRVYSENKTLLTELDAAIGDADHGINLDRGFTAVAAKLAAAHCRDTGTVFKTAAMALIQTVGGASGPLYGTFFLRAGTAAAGKTELTPADLVAALDAGLQGVVQLGKTEPEDKTMVDAMAPAISAMRQAQENGSDLASLLLQGAAAAETGMRRTIPLQAKKGRASYLGKRSIGHQDPGATSACLMFRSAADVWGTDNADQ